MLAPMLRNFFTCNSMYTKCTCSDLWTKGGSILVLSHEKGDPNNVDKYRNIMLKGIFSKKNHSK